MDLLLRVPLAAGLARPANSQLPARLREHRARHRRDATRPSAPAANCARWRRVRRTPATRQAEERGDPRESYARARRVARVPRRCCPRRKNHSCRKLSKATQVPALAKAKLRAKRKDASWRRAPRAAARRQLRVAPGDSALARSIPLDAHSRPLVQRATSAIHRARQPASAEVPRWPRDLPAAWLGVPWRDRD